MSDPPEGSLAHFIRWLEGAVMNEEALYAWDKSLPYSWVQCMYEQYTTSHERRSDAGVVD